MRLKCILQHDETDCGAACLSMVLDYYGKSVPIRKIREEACTDTKGTSGFGMVKAAQKYGLSCKAFCNSSINISNCFLSKDISNQSKDCKVDSDDFKTADEHTDG